jgi:hypothetical protein
MFASNFLMGYFTNKIKNNLCFADSRPLSGNPHFLQQLGGLRPMIHQGSPVTRRCEANKEPLPERKKC